MVLVDRYSILDIAGKHLLLILKPSAYLKLDILMPLMRNLPGSKCFGFESQVLCGQIYSEELNRVLDSDPGLQK
jgi:hypothetical protein